MLFLGVMLVGVCAPPLPVATVHVRGHGSTSLPIHALDSPSNPGYVVPMHGSKPQQREPGRPEHFVQEPIPSPAGKKPVAPIIELDPRHDQT